MTRISGVIGDSPAIGEACARIERLLDHAAGARRPPPLLLEGETGTGKGLLARAIHRAGPRRDRPLVDVNCAAIPETLLEAEMFGFERGAFTDARQAKPGLFETADGGMLFLDEVGRLPEALQPKLLKAIEEQAVRRLGSTRDRAVDVWIVAATNEDLETLVRDGRFRADLYHRLAVVTIRLPALRERGGDVRLLAEHFLAATCRDYGLPARRLGDDAHAALAAHDWPGNVRELANVVERAALLSDAAVLSAADLELPAPAAPAAARPARERGVTLSGLPPAGERERLLEALSESGGNLSRAAARLGIARNTLRYRLEVHGLRAAPPSRRGLAERRAAPPAAPVASVFAPGARPVVHREKRRVVVVRAAVAGADGRAASAGGRAVAVVADKLGAFGGTLEDVGAGHVTALFGHDGAEDAARRAALAVAAARRSLERDDRPSPVTAAIHVEECAVSEVGEARAVDAGDRRRALDAVQRLAAVAAPGSTIAAAGAATSLGRWFDLAPAGRLPGDGGALYRVVGAERPGLGARGPATPFVGRGEELAWLRARLRAALEGRGQAVGVVGEAGIGKSRLVAELRDDPIARDARLLEGRCYAHATTTAYLPFVAVLRQLCDLDDAARPDAVTAGVESALAAAGMESRDGAPYLLELLGISGQASEMSAEMVKRRTFESLRALLLRTAEARPVLLVVEDLHWIDETSDALLGVLVDGLARTRVMVVATYRPGYRPRWLDRSYAAQLALAPLSADESLAVVRRVLADAVPAAVADAIIARGEGNPFFLEELSRALLDDGRTADASALPGSVHDVLAGRIGRLAPDDRRLLQAAAVVGRDVGDDVLRAVAGEPGAVLDGRLQRLEAAEFIVVTRAGPAPAYAFKHALTHEVAYRSLLPDVRRDLHGRALAALGRLGPGVAGEHVEELARHALGAEQWEPATRYLRQAATRAAARSANREAVALAEQALAAAARLPGDLERAERELALHMTRGVALIGMHGWAAPAVEEAFARARDACRRVGPTPRLLGVLLGLWAFHLFRGSLAIARELADECLAVAAPQARPSLRGWALLAGGTTSFWLGRLPEACRRLEESLALYDLQEQRPLAKLYGQDSGATCLAYLAQARTALGDPDLGVRTADEAVALAGQLAHPYTTAMALVMAAGTHQLRGDAPSARRRAEAAIALATDKGFPAWAAMASFHRGWAVASEGDVDGGIEQMRRSVGAWRSLGMQLSLPWLLAVLAEALCRRHRADEALATVEDALAVGARTADAWHESETRRVYGLALALRKRPDEAEAELRRAVALAEQRATALLEARALLALGRFLEARGSSAAEPRQRLAEVCGRLPATAGASDLAEARAWLAGRR